MKTIFLSSAFLLISATFMQIISRDVHAEVPISSETEECIACHEYLNPGLVASWNQSLHARITPLEAFKKDELERRISKEVEDEKLKLYAVGCYECHSLNTSDHADSFEHNGYQINVVVSSNDCATCHPVEADQYSNNLMAHAYGNLMDNVVYTDLRNHINGTFRFHEDQLSKDNANSKTEEESCLYCHGTKLEVTGTVVKDTDFGELEFPVIKGWPNQGVGRINPDGSLGACTSCHPRHDFSIETARQPYTCSECHKGPDVPAFKVYEVSKHGNIFSSKKSGFNFTNVPWVVGEDFTAPTCAACHVSLLVDADGNKIAERSHQFNDRLAWRLFGVPYAHPHPIAADVSNIKNKAGLPLATELSGEPVMEYLISEEEQNRRNERMQNVCASCHSDSWIKGHFERIENTIAASNASTLAATNMVAKAWEMELAKGIPQSSSIFDEKIERDWTSTWLFYANSVRFTSAMGGGGDYGVFANGRYQLSNKLIEMQEWLEIHKMMKLNKSGKKKKK